MPMSRPKASGPLPRHDSCRQTLVDGMREVGVEITVSTKRPLVVGPYTTDGYVCPHGTEFWIEPTGEQIARWVEEGVG